MNSEEEDVFIIVTERYSIKRGQLKTVGTRMGYPIRILIRLVVKINGQTKYSYFNCWRSYGHLTWVTGRSFVEESRSLLSLGFGDISQWSCGHFSLGSGEITQWSCGHFSLGSGDITQWSYGHFSLGSGDITQWSCGHFSLGSGDITQWSCGHFSLGSGDVTQWSCGHFSLGSGDITQCSCGHFLLGSGDITQWSCGIDKYLLINISTSERARINKFRNLKNLRIWKIQTNNFLLILLHFRMWIM